MLKKLFIEDWKRKGYAYDTAFVGEQYHLVQNRNSSTMEVHKNRVGSLISQSHTAIKFDKAEKPSNLNSLNESRFLNIDKSPKPYSKYERVPIIQFKKQMGRPDQVFGKPKLTLMYNPKIEQVQSRRDKGVPNLQKTVSRDSSKVLEKTISVVNLDKAMEAKKNLNPNRSSSVQKFFKMKARDDLLLESTDRMANNILEHTKDERECFKCSSRDMRSLLVTS